MQKLIKSKGDCRNLIIYKKSLIIYELTYYFAQTYLRHNDRTVDQMIQAARSGKQNIIEGCEAGATSSKTELKLINVAKASLQELLEDYTDYLSTRSQPQWQKGSPEYEVMRNLGREHDDPAFFMEIARTRPPQTIANMAIILINQTDYLLHRFLAKLDNDFITQGGFTERMYRQRTGSRTPNSDRTGPNCTNPH